MFLVYSILTCTKSCSSPTIVTLTLGMSICDDICISSEIIIIINVFFLYKFLLLFQTKSIKLIIYYQ